MSKEFALNFASSSTKLQLKPRMLKEAFGEQAFSQARTFEWFTRLKDGRESVDCGRLSRCRTPEMIAKVREVILEDRLSTMFVNVLDCHTGHVNAF
jgi:hypothetical protein